MFWIAHFIDSDWQLVTHKNSQVLFNYQSDSIEKVVESTIKSGVLSEW